MNFATLEEMVSASFDAMRPIERLSVTEAAEKYHIIRQPGSHNGPWSRAKTPYLVEPQDVLTSLDHVAMIFAGPARTGKSLMLTNWLAHSAICDPADTMVVHMAQHTAREWVKSDLEKSFRNSPALRALLSPARSDDNIFDKRFLSGMRQTTTWPTANNLSGKTIPRQWLMDYDRMDDDVDGEGDPFSMTAKRGGTFGRFKMTAAESSPGREVTDPKWQRSSPHEAPPCTGILGLYNMGDRRRWYWACPQCDEAFEPDFPLLKWVDHPDPMDAADTVYMVCPHCGGVMEPDEKDALNSRGRWVRDGMMWLPSQDLMVTRPGCVPVRSDIASFWLKGPAAGFQEWRGLVLNWLRAEKAYRETGDEQKLRVTTNTDQGLPYISRARLSAREPDRLQELSEDWGSTQDDPTVPEGVRFLIATVDVQARSFVVQVHGFAVGGDVVIVDSYRILLSERVDADGNFLPIEPPVFREDWDLLIPKVILRSYPLADDSGRRMPVKLVGCDSGGREGSTANAYSFWRRLKLDPAKLHRRFALVKGNSTPKAPRAYTSWPDSSKRGVKAVAKGEVPVVLLGSNLLKDQLSSMLDRRSSDGAAQGGMLRFPSWMPGWFYSQMTNEVKNEKGVWENPARRRNETWDLAYMALGIAVRGSEDAVPFPTIQFEKIQWDNPPIWASHWDANPDIIPAWNRNPTARVVEKKEIKPKRFAELGDKLG